jgi:hypothetical protein
MKDVPIARFYFDDELEERCVGSVWTYLGSEAIHLVF